MKWVPVLVVLALGVVVARAVLANRHPSVTLADGAVLTLADVDDGMVFHSYPHGIPQRLRSLVPGWVASKLGMGRVPQLSFGDHPTTGILLTFTTVIPPNQEVPPSPSRPEAGKRRYDVTVAAADVPEARPVGAEAFLQEAHLDGRTVVERHFMGAIPRRATALDVRVFASAATGQTNLLHTFRIPNPVRVEPKPVPGEPPPVVVRVESAEARRVVGQPPDLVDDLRMVFSVTQEGKDGSWNPIQVLEVGDEGGNRKVLPTPIQLRADGKYQVHVLHGALPGDTQREVLLEFALDQGANPDLKKPMAETRRRMWVKVP